jgi:hypothetical protein
MTSLMPSKINAITKKILILEKNKKRGKLELWIEV